MNVCIYVCDAPKFKVLVIVLKRNLDHATSSVTR